MNTGEWVQTRDQALGQYMMTKPPSKHMPAPIRSNLSGETLSTCHPRKIESATNTSW